jgi:hypothetical protein
MSVLTGTDTSERSSGSSVGGASDPALGGTVRGHRGAVVSSPLTRQAFESMLAGLAKSFVSTSLDTFLAKDPSVDRARANRERERAAEVLRQGAVAGRSTSSSFGSLGGAAGSVLQSSAGFLGGVRSSSGKPPKLVVSGETEDESLQTGTTKVSLVENTLFQGYLLKQRKGTHNLWKKRWIVLTRGNMHFFESPSRSSTVKVRPLDLARFVLSDSVDNAFDIDFAPGQVYTMQAASKEECTQWLKELAAAGSKDPDALRSPRRVDARPLDAKSDSVTLIQGTIRQGYLTKKKAGSLNIAKSRWIVLDNSSLYFFESPTLGASHKVRSLKAGKVTVTGSSKFEVRFAGSGDTFQFEAEDEEERDAWVADITRVSSKDVRAIRRADRVDSMRAISESLSVKSLAPDAAALPRSMSTTSNDGSESDADLEKFLTSSGGGEAATTTATTSTGEEE